MQYTRRRILRVSGVTIRDEHQERRDFTTSASTPVHEEWDEFLSRKNEDSLSRRRTPMADWDRMRERT